MPLCWLIQSGRAYCRWSTIESGQQVEKTAGSIGTVEGTKTLETGGLMMHPLIPWLESMIFVLKVCTGAIFVVLLISAYKLYRLED